MTSLTFPELITLQMTNLTFPKLLKTRHTQYMALIANLLPETSEPIQQRFLYREDLANLEPSARRRLETRGSPIIGTDQASEMISIL